MGDEILKNGRVRQYRDYFSNLWKGGRPVALPSNPLVTFANNTANQTMSYDYL